MYTQHIAVRYGLNPKRSLGQNFLTDETVKNRIADTVVTDALPVLEIGAGLGALTAILLARGARLVAVEIDARLCEILAAELPGAHVLHTDFLNLDPRALMDMADFCAVGNLPYYVTTPISEKLLSALPARAVLMVQKEAAARFFAAPGDRVYGPLAILAQQYYRPERLFTVPPQAFWPEPHVDSVVIRLTRLSTECPLVPEALLRFCKKAFGMRRKTLVNNFQRDQCLLDALEAHGLPSDVRAEALSPRQLAALCQIMEDI